MKPQLFQSLLVAVATAAFPLAASAAVLNHWTFDETSGLVAADGGGTIANDAIWENAEGDGLVWTSGLIGGAAELDGVQDGSHSFEVGGIEADGIEQMSYAMWIKPNLEQAGTGGDYRNKGLFTSGDVEALRTSGPVSNQFWGATWQATTDDPETAEWRFRVDATGATTTSSVYDGTEVEPEWIHMAFVWDGTAGAPESGDEEFKVYVNGQLDTMRNHNAAQIIEDGTWRIGVDRHFGGRTFGGLIDDLVVWDEVLTDDDISTIYTEGLNGVDAPTALLGDALLGDVNDDGLVNSADFDVIQQNFWQEFSEKTDGDLVDNDFIDFSDYAQWKQAAKDPDPLVAASQAVPEPNTGVLILGLSLIGLALRRC